MGLELVLAGGLGTCMMPRDRGFEGCALSGDAKGVAVNGATVRFCDGTLGVEGLLEPRMIEAVGTDSDCPPRAADGESV